MHKSSRSALSTSHLMLLTALITISYILSPAAGAIDKTKYITIDEISTDMDAYCLTVLKGNEIEKFPLKLLSIVRSKQPGQDRILAIGTDPRFIHDGPVQGCSGSPVYIDGRMAGALSAGWSTSKDPLYLITPIADMLDVGKFTPSADHDFPDASWTASVDFSSPLDLNAIYEKINARQTTAANNIPLVTSLPQSVCDNLAPQLKAMGLRPLAAPQLLTSPDPQAPEEFEYVPGSVLAIPFITGDIIMAGTGTVTEVVGNKVYGFGHQMDGTGPVNLPMATGYVHTVVASDVGSSFKLATAGQIKGALRSDESAAVYGEIDKVAPMIPLKITVDRFNDTQTRTYNCSIVTHRGYTPQILQSAIAGAAMMKGPVPRENLVTYSAKIDVEGFDPITFSNISSGSSIFQMLSETVSTVSLLLSNPYQIAKINSFEFNVKIEPKNIRSVIESVNISRSTVKPGQSVNIAVILKPYMSRRKMHNISLTIPENTPPGEYEILIASPSEYFKRLRKLQPQNYIAKDLPTIVSSLKNITAVDRTKLYVLMSLPSSGIVIENKPLPSLPPTKALLLGDKKRTVKIMPNFKWIENSIKIDTLLVSRSVMKIKVEKP